MYTTVVKPEITVIQPQGNLNAANVTEFKTQLTQAVEVAGLGVIVDMEQVESLDSAALMALVSGLSLAQRTNKRLSLCCISPSIKMILEITQLERFFAIYENRVASESAMA